MELDDFLDLVSLEKVVFLEEWNFFFEGLNYYCFYRVLCLFFCVILGIEPFPLIINFLLLEIIWKDHQHFLAIYFPTIKMLAIKYWESLFHELIDSFSCIFQIHLYLDLHPLNFVYVSQRSSIFSIFFYKHTFLNLCCGFPLNPSTKG